MARGNGDRKDIPERFTWKCDRKGCNAKGKAANRQDAAMAKALHVAMTHDR